MVSSVEYSAWRAEGREAADPGDLNEFLHVYRSAPHLERDDDGKPEPWKIVPGYWGDAPRPTRTGVGVTWLSGFQFEIK